MKAKVEAVTEAKSKKSLRIKLGENWYGAKKDSGLDVAKGKVIEAEILPDEGYGEWIGKWSYANGSAAASVPTNNGGNHEGLTEAELRFISNVVGCAIESETLTDPADIGVWANAARAALKELA